MQETNELITGLEYQNSLNQNYLVYKNEQGEGDYELRMLVDNCIDHLLPVELRSIDGRSDLYFKIESFQPLGKIYKNREMKLEDVRIILIGLTGAIAEIQEYMLDEKHIVLWPEYIFMRAESREIRLLFHPFYKGDIREGIRDFSEYLIGRIDHTEQQAVMMGYQFYRIVREDNFIIEDIVNLYQRDAKNYTDKNEEIMQVKDIETNQGDLKNKPAYEETYYTQYEMAGENKKENKSKMKHIFNLETRTPKSNDIKNKELSVQNAENLILNEENIKGRYIHSKSISSQMMKYKEKNNRGINDKKYLNETDEKTETNLKMIFVFSVLAIMSGLFLCFGIGHYQPDRMAKVISALVMLVSVFGIGKEVIHHFRNRKNYNCEENNYDKIFADFDKTLNGDIDDWKKQDHLEAEVPDSKMFAQEIGQEETENIGRTVLLSAYGKAAENILMEKKRGKEVVHHLNEFPYVIGKIKDSVDLVLNDVSVSRIHAKLTEENGQVYVQDCNSTNGTYVNGVLLEKEEKIPIEADDEIRIGRISLLYQ